MIYCGKNIAYKILEYISLGAGIGAMGSRQFDQFRSADDQFFLALVAVFAFSWWSAMIYMQWTVGWRARQKMLDLMIIDQRQTGW